MNRLLIAVILILDTLPLFAQGQASNAAQLKADAQNVVRVISGDRLKTQIYCEIRDLTDEAEHEENPAKTEELSEQIDNLEGKLGPEFIILVHALTDTDAHSQDLSHIAVTYANAPAALFPATRGGATLGGPRSILLV